MTKSVLSAAKEGKVMSLKQLSQLEQMHDRMINKDAKQAKSMSVKSVMEQADESQLAMTQVTGHHAGPHAKHSAALAKMKGHHSLGIANLLEGGGIKEEVGTQKLVQTDLAQIPDDFIPKDSPAYQMVMQARMAAQQETLSHQQGVIAMGEDKDEYNDKMKRLDENNMPGAVEAQGSRNQKLGPQHMLDSLAEPESQQLDSLAEPQLQQLDQEAEFSGDSLAGDDEAQETMLSQDDDSAAQNANFDAQDEEAGDSLSADFDSLAEQDDDSSVPLDSPQQSYAGDHALMLGSM
jgi:hypothetical protein